MKLCLTVFAALMAVAIGAPAAADATADPSTLAIVDPTDVPEAPKCIKKGDTCKFGGEPCCKVPGKLIDCRTQHDDKYRCEELKSDAVVRDVNGNTSTLAIVDPTDVPEAPKCIKKGDTCKFGGEPCCKVPGKLTDCRTQHDGKYRCEELKSDAAAGDVVA